MKKILKLTSNLSKLQCITLIITKTMHWNFNNIIIFLKNFTKLVVNPNKVMLFEHLNRVIITIDLIRKEWKKTWIKRLSDNKIIVKIIKKNHCNKKKRSIIVKIDWVWYSEIRVLKNNFTKLKESCSWFFKSVSS